MKYIVMQTTRKGMVREFPILFPDALTHAVVAAALERHCEELTGARPVSAGFISSTVIDEGCYGESETLRLKSRGAADDQLIAMLDYTHGIR